MKSGWRASLIVAGVALAVAGCSNGNKGGMSNMSSPSPMATSGAVSTDDATTTTTTGSGVGGSTMQNCNVLKGRIAAGQGLSAPQQAMIPQCERLLGTNLRANTYGNAPSPTMAKPY
ncbi:MAG: hypothetical protein JOZ42_17240 [Acetobacteraceae bacterium]|nr:hypothetical protein [Acetobacteraceae bacterium]